MSADLSDVDTVPSDFINIEQAGDISADEQQPTIVHEYIRKSNGLKLAHLNVRSLPKNLDQMRILLHESTLDVMSLNETFLNDDFNDADLAIPGFLLFRKDRGSRHGGGVAFYVNDSLNVNVMTELHPSTSDVECLWIRITRPHQKPLIVGTMYRPPNANQKYFEAILDVLDSITNQEQDVVVMGDLNYNCLITNNVTLGPMNHIEQLTGLTQIVNQPTRIEVRANGTIDAILTTDPSKHHITGVIPVTLTDHYMPYTVIRGKSNNKSKPKNITTRDFKHFNVDQFKRDMYAAMPPIYDQIDADLDTAWSLWKNTFQTICSKHAPLKSIRVKNRSNPWMTRDILKRMYNRDYLHKKANQRKSQELWEQYKCARNDVVHAIKKAQSDYYRDQIDANEGNRTNMWRAVKNILGAPNPTTSNNITADAFNSYFSTVGSKLAEDCDDTPYSCTLPSSIHSFELTAGDVNFVYDQLRLLRDKSNLDILNIDCKLLRLSASAVAPSLSKIINLSISSGTIPDDWKTSKVTPIYKGKGPTDDCGNYRPISVISHIAKIMEKVVLRQLKTYLEEHKFISNCQSAFIKNNSTTTAIHRIISDVLEGINEDELTAMCFIDLRKCFDTIDHEILLKKLSMYGISGATFSWFENYLKGRKQCVKLDGAMSTFLDIVIGIPQGSILGPILFLLFINDLPNCISGSQCNLFADDTVIYAQSNSPLTAQTILQEDIHNIAKWFNKNRLHINASKSSCMVLSTRQINDVDVIINDTPLTVDNKVKYLGVTISKDLTWNHHIANVCKKLGHGIQLIRKLKQILPLNDLITLYKTVIQPHIDYCLTVWGYAPACQLNRVQRLQNKMFRMMTGNYDWNTSISGILKDFNIPNISQRRDYFNGVQMYRSLHGTLPDYMSDQIHYVHELNVRETRQANQLYVPMPRKELYRQSFQYTGTTFYNSVPHEIKDTLSLSTFKRELRRHIMS